MRFQGGFNDFGCYCGSRRTSCTPPGLATTEIRNAAGVTVTVALLRGSSPSRSQIAGSRYCNGQPSGSPGHTVIAVGACEAGLRSRTRRARRRCGSLRKGLGSGASPPQPYLILLCAAELSGAVAHSGTLSLMACTCATVACITIRRGGTPHLATTWPSWRVGSASGWPQGVLAHEV